MASWYLRTRPRRGRVSIVRGFEMQAQPDRWNMVTGKYDAQPLRPRVLWAATRADALAFPTRAQAIAYRDIIEERATANGYWNGAKRWVAVNADVAPRPAAAFKPKQTVRATDAELARVALAVTSAREHAARAGLTLPDFKVFVTTGRRTCRGGRHRDGLFYISLDRWAFEREDDGTKPGYLTYIVAHELAHVADVYHHGRTSHGPQFMAHLRKLCPLHLQAYELGYKPTEARRAGISLRDAAPEVAAAVKPRRDFPPPNIVRLLEKAAAELKAEGVIG